MRYALIEGTDGAPRFLIRPLWRVYYCAYYYFPNPEFRLDVAHPCFPFVQTSLSSPNDEVTLTLAERPRSAKGSGRGSTVDQEVATRALRERRLTPEACSNVTLCFALALRSNAIY